MIRSDYILRQIQQLVQVLARVMMLRTSRPVDEVHEEILLALKSVFGLSSLELVERSDDALLELCMSGGAVNGELALALADLLEQEGELYWDDRQAELANRYLRKTLFLYETVLTRADTAPLNIHDKIEYLKQRIDSHEQTN